MNGGMINSITRLHLVGYFYWVTLRCTDPWILNLKTKVYFPVTSLSLHYNGEITGKENCERSHPYCWGVRNWSALPTSHTSTASDYGLSQIFSRCSGPWPDHRDKERAIVGPKLCGLSGDPRSHDTERNYRNLKCVNIKEAEFVTAVGYI
jgi:hypothetical protein